MFVQQGSRGPFLLRTRECPDYVANEGRVFFAYINFQSGHSLALKALPETADGFTLLLSQYETSDEYFRKYIRK